MRASRWLMLIAALARAEAATRYAAAPNLLPCSMTSGLTRAVVRVERDTTLPATPFGGVPLSMSGGLALDSTLAVPGTPMPAARVRILRLDSITRADLAAQGLREAQPAAFIRAYRYGAGCEPLRWTDTAKFVTTGEIGYVHAVLAPRDEWIGNAPLLIVFQGNVYPGRRQSPMPLATPFALYSFEDAIDLNIPAPRPEPNSTLAQRQRAISWAKANPRDAELEPIRTAIRQQVLAPEWGRAERIPSRLRGTYRANVDANGRQMTWYFRTHDRPSFEWQGPDSLRLTTASLLASPYLQGYRLVGYGASTLDSLATSAPTRGALPIVWLATTDRPTLPGNDARSELSGTFEFSLEAIPKSLWDVVEPLVPRLSPADSALWARLGGRRRGAETVLVPIRVRIDASGGVGTDPVFAGNGVRISLQRVDTVSVRRPWRDD